MEVELTNFRCWKNKKVRFENGLVLLSGSSGSGKSSILNAIFFAITGIGNKIISYNEKKCSVLLSFDNGSIQSILRTKNPGRLVVTIKNDNNETYQVEDDEAQSVIDNYFGSYFHQTSYMSQKMIHSFLTLSAVEKMNFLQKFVLDDSSIVEMKKQRKDTIQSSKQKSNEAAAKLQILEQELSLLPDVNVDTNQITDEVKNFNPLNLQNIQNDLQNIQSNIRIYDQLLCKIDSNNQQLKQKKTELLSIESELEKENTNKQQLLSHYEGDDTLNTNNRNLQKYKFLAEICKLDHDIESNTKWIESFLQEQVTLVQDQLNKQLQQKQELESSHLFVLYSQIQKLQELQQLIKEQIVIDSDFQQLIGQYTFIKNAMTSGTTIDNALQCVLSYITRLETSIQDKQTQLDTIKSAKVKLTENWKIRSKIHKCPSCKSSLCFNDTHLALANQQPMQENEYKQELEKQQQQEKSVQDLLTKQTNQVTQLQKIQTSLTMFQTKLQEISNKLVHYHQSLFEFLKMNKTNNQNVDFAVTAKLIESVTSEKSKYSHVQNEIDSLTKKLEQIQKQQHPQILHKKQQIQLLNSKKQQKQNDFAKIFPDQILPEFFNNIDQLETEQQSLSSKILEQNNFRNRLQNIDKDINSKSKQISQLQTSIESLQLSIDTLIEQKQQLSNVYEQELFLKEQLEYQQSIQQLHFKYSEFVNSKQKEIRLKNEIRIQKYIRQSNDNEIVVNEHLLKKIQEAESLTLNYCIDNVNLRINEYLDKFFPNDSIVVNIVSFKDTLKKDIKPGINIEVSYKGEEIELNSLSGGEYDRVALAIMLAFNSISKSNLVLLDESIASLDSELTNDILEKLKNEMNEQSSTKMIIVVAHQLSTGVFDQIISTSS